jgi:hypothetical protein
MKKYGGMEIELHAFFGTKCMKLFASFLDRFTLGEIAPGAHGIGG